MKLKRILKRLVIASLSLTIIICCFIGFSKKPKAATFSQGETFYNEKYKELYTLYFGDVPPSFEIMIDIACNADHSLSINQAIDLVYFQMIEFYSQNAKEIYGPIYEEKGYNAGKTDCESTHDTIKQNSYNEGYDVGLGDGIKKGYAEYENERGSALKLKDIFTQIINAPFKIIKEVLNFDIFGVNISSLVFFVVSGCLVFFVVRFFLKG